MTAIRSMGLFFNCKLYRKNVKPNPMEIVLLLGFSANVQSTGYEEHFYFKK